MKSLPIVLIFISCGFFETKNNTNEPLFLAAKDAGFLKDEFVQEDIKKLNRKIVSEKYIESLMVGRTAVAVSEVEGYYKKNKNQFKRLGDEALVLMFEGQDKSGAIKIKNILDRNNFDSERVSKTIQKHSPRRMFLEKRDLRVDFSERVFKKTGGSFIVKRSNGFVVFYTINIFKMGSLKELVDVSDGIQAKILALKKYKLKQTIKDSLYILYGTNYK